MSNTQNTGKIPEGTDKSPWIDQSPLPRMPLFPALSLSLVAVFFSVLTALGFYDPLAFAYLAISGACAAIVIILTRSPFILILPAASYGFSLLLSKSPTDSGAALIYFPAAVVIALCIYRSKSRVSTVCVVSFTLAVTLISFFSIAIYKEYGALNMTTLNTLLQDIKDGFRTVFASAQTINEEGQSVRIYNDDTIDFLYNSILVLSPGIIITIINALSFASVKIVQLMFGAFKLMHMLPEQNWKFTVSAPGAITFFVAYIVSLFFTADSITIPRIIAANIICILMPGLFIVGINQVILLIKHKRVYFSSVIIIFVTIIIFLFQPVVFVSAVAFLGGFRCIKDSGIIRLPKINP